MKTSLRAARFRELAAECSSLAATAPMPQIRDQYRAMARHYLMLAETHGRKAHPNDDVVCGGRVGIDIVWKKEVNRFIRGGIPFFKE